MTAKAKKIQDSGSKIQEAKKKVVKVKTVNLTGKEIKKEATVIRQVKEVKPVEGKEAIQKLNEKVMSDKIQKTSNKSQVTGDVAESKKENIEKQVREEPQKEYKPTIEIRDLLKAGCHLGHKVSKTHPKIRPYLFRAQDGIQVFDLLRTYPKLVEALTFVYNARLKSKKIVMVGTKRQAKEVVKRIAVEAGVAYVTNRWLGGTITNWDQIRQVVTKYETMKQKWDKGEYNSESKREQSVVKKELVRLGSMVEGLIGHDKMFEVMIVVDAGFEKTAVREAKNRGLKVVGLVDTDGDPNRVDFVIPTNDDNVKSVTLIMEEIGKALGKEREDLGNKI